MFGLGILCDTNKKKILLLIAKMNFRFGAIMRSFSRLTINGYYHYHQIGTDFSLRNRSIRFSERVQCNKSITLNMLQRE